MRCRRVQTPAINPGQTLQHPKILPHKDSASQKGLATERTPSDQSWANPTSPQLPMSPISPISPGWNAKKNESDAEREKGPLPCTNNKLMPLNLPEGRTTRPYHAYPTRKRSASTAPHEAKRRQRHTPNRRNPEPQHGCPSSPTLARQPYHDNPTQNRKTHTDTPGNPARQAPILTIWERQFGKQKSSRPGKGKPRPAPGAGTCL